MDLLQIKTLLDSPDPQARMKALTELRHHEAESVVPLLKRRVNDRELIIRSFVVIGLGNKRNDEGFETLLSILEYETDPNLIAEVANSLSKFGPVAIPYLVPLFEQNDHWLVRQSILAASSDFDAPEVVLKLCRLGFNSNEGELRRGAIANLVQLVGTPQSPEALDLLLQAAADQDADMRAAAARVLRQFDDPQAKAALAELRQDSDHRVVGAVLDGLL